MLSFRFLTVLYVLGASVLPTHAATIREFIASADKDSNVIQRVFAAGEAFSWANTFLEAKNQTPLFCPPQKLALNPGNYFRFLTDAIARDPSLNNDDDRVYPFHLLMELKRVFPCGAG
jgi:hypothetical protein